MMNNRILKICDLVTFPVTAEIGADHGKISMELIKSSKVKKVYLSDISEKCIQKAIDNFSENNISDSAEFLVGDGLLVFDKPLTNVEGIIAGMGGMEIMNILSNPNRVDNISNFVLQPQKNVVQLREFLIKNGFKILKDVMVKDMGKFYNVLKVTKGEDSLTELELNFGRTNLKEYNEDFIEFLNNALEFFTNAAKLTSSDIPKSNIRLLEEAKAVLIKENIIC